MSTYGSEACILNLVLRRDFAWNFIVADEEPAIIGADFSAHYSLVIGLHDNQLIGNTTRLSSRGQVVQCTTPGIKVVSGGSHYHMRYAITGDLVNARTVNVIQCATSAT